MRQHFIDLKEKIQNKFQDQVFNFIENADFLQFYVEKEMNLRVLTFLFDECEFQFLTDLTAAHYPEKINKEIEVVYHIHNLTKNLRIRLKATLPITNPEIFTATSLFSGANWMERETYDFFGVIFKGHPNLKRILNVEEMDYFPLRKEYGLEDNVRLDKDDEMFGRKNLTKNH